MIPKATLPGGRAATAQEMIERVSDLPALPQAGIKLLHLLEDPDGNAEEVVKVVRTDAVLSGKLLRICNSPAFGFRQPVSSVGQAVMAIGFAEVQRLAIALTFGGVMHRPLAGYDIDAEAYWLHSLLVGLGAEALAEAVPRFRSEASAAYTAGLLHDIGKLVLNQTLAPEPVAAIRELIETEGRAALDAEREVLGVDHAEVGAGLLEKWKLPACLVEAVRWHHQPEFSPQPTLSVLVHMADCLAHQFGSSPGWGGGAIRMEEAAIASLGFDAAQHQLALMAVLEQIDKARQFTTTA